MEVKITTCPVCGNRYFQDDYPECPVCAGSIKRRQGETEAMTDREYDMNGSATLPLHTPETERRAEVKTEADVGKTLPPDHVPQRPENWKRTSGDMGETRPPYDVKVGTKPPKPDGPNEGGQTVPVWDVTPDPRRKHPVVGWLVALNGEHRGEAYQITGYNTTIGRERGNKIVLTGDPCISATHCSIRYFSEPNSYFIYYSEAASNPVYVNKEPLHEHAQLHTYDRIFIGRTELLFVPLCGREFSWNGEKTCR